jgi:hypothetical protein
MRVWWHPDRVGALAGKENKVQWEVMAKEVFCEVGTLVEEIEMKDSKGKED